MNEISEFFEWADNPEIPSTEVRKKLEELKKKGLITEVNPPKDEDEGIYIGRARTILETYGRAKNFL
ncbi:MAG: hypothetical protein AB4368_17460 [Xenococcaceae cyanobacterium]